jgi:opacity protein-like surface antigen
MLKLLQPIKTYIGYAIGSDIEQPGKAVFGGGMSFVVTDRPTSSVDRICSEANSCSSPREGVWRSWVTQMPLRRYERFRRNALASPDPRLQQGA